MAKLLEKNIQLLIISLEDLNKENFLIPYQTKYNEVLRCCIELLKKNNYAIIKKPKSAKNVVNTKGLIDLYYHILVRVTKISPYRNDTIDFTIAKKLIENIQLSTGFDYKTSLMRAVNLIEGVFKYRKDLNIEPDVLRSFSVFGQGKLSWITDRVVSLLNKEMYNNDILMAKADLLAEEYAKNNNVEFGLPNLQELAEEIGKEHGKEKRN